MVAQRILYSLLLYALAPLAFAATMLRGVRDPSYRDRLTERFGFTRLKFSEPPIWIHAVSVGEVQAATALVRALLLKYPQRPILLTTGTPTGAQRVQALFANSVAHAYLPYDLRGSVRRFLQRVQPRIVVVMEREIWPNLFAECQRQQIPILLASARLSPTSAWRSGMAARLVRPLFEAGITVAAQTEQDAQRFRELGAPAGRTHASGNVKFDQQFPVSVQRDGELLRAQHFSSRPVWIAGSTHEGEEAAALDAHARIVERHANALLILVPRHPNRFDEVKQLLRSRHVSFVARSTGTAVTAETSVLLLDTLGELMLFYAAADVAFVAGSLAPIGGHNLLEPAALGLPIVIGPHNFNAPDIAAMFVERQAAVQVSNATELPEAVRELLSDQTRRREMGERARALLASNRGAVERVLALIDAQLPS